MFRLSLRLLIRATSKKFNKSIDWLERYPLPTTLHHYQLSTSHYHRPLSQYADIVSKRTDTDAKMHRLLRVSADRSLLNKHFVATLPAISELACEGVEFHLHDVSVLESYYTPFLRIIVFDRVRVYFPIVS